MRDARPVAKVRSRPEHGHAAAQAHRGYLREVPCETWQRRLLVLAPVGRMALTNYLSQTVISLFIYYGFGLGMMGKLSPAGTIGLTLAIFCAQVAFSHWWLARFRFGPAEWVWRSLTYGKAQPMRQPTAPVVAAVTAS